MLVATAPDSKEVDIEELEKVDLDVYVVAFAVSALSSIVLTDAIVLFESKVIFVVVRVSSST